MLFFSGIYSYIILADIFPAISAYMRMPFMFVRAIGCA
jgi:hypothetical protein